MRAWRICASDSLASRGAHARHINSKKEKREKEKRRKEGTHSNLTVVAIPVRAVRYSSEPRQPALEQHTVAAVI
jgi:hypothetical protein